MIEFYGYNDARAIAAYNKRNLTKMFMIFALICFFISIIAIAIPLYELLYVWGVFLFLLLIVLFASSFSKYDDKILKAYQQLIEIPPNYQKYLLTYTNHIEYDDMIHIMAKYLER